MVNIVDVYMAAFYFLTFIVLFVFIITACIYLDFYVATSKEPNEAGVELRYHLVAFRKVTHHQTLEFWWTVIPSVIIFFIALPALLLIYALETPMAAPALTVKAIGHQWYWSYEYTDHLDPEIFQDYNTGFTFDSYMLPEDRLTLGQRRLLEVDKAPVLPVETQIRIVVTSSDVLHSWALPSLGVKMDAIPGRLNQFYLYIPYSGLYYGQCSELCGANHGFMPIALYAVEPEDFVDWYLGKFSKV